LRFTHWSSKQLELAHDVYSSIVAHVGVLTVGADIPVVWTVTVAGALPVEGFTVTVTVAAVPVGCAAGGCAVFAPVVVVAVVLVLAPHSVGHACWTSGAQVPRDCTPQATCAFIKINL